METLNNQGWLNKNLKAILIIFFLILFAYFLFNPKKITEIKNIFTESKSLNPDSLNKKTEETASVDLKILNQKEENKIKTPSFVIPKDKDLEESKVDKERKTELEDLRQKNKDLIGILKNTIQKDKGTKTEDTKYKENNTYIYMYPLWNPDGSRRKLFYSKVERQNFANEHGLIFIDPKDDPIKVIGEGEFFFEHDNVIYRFRDFPLAAEARSNMGLSWTTTIIKGFNW